MSSNEPTREELLAAIEAARGQIRAWSKAANLMERERDAARAEFETSEEHLAAIVRAWEELDPGDRSAAHLRQLSREIRDAMASRAGEWWR